MPFRHIVSIRSRKTDLVDILIDNQEGNSGFTLKFCQSLQGSYSDTVIIPQFIGGVSSTIAAIPQRDYTGHGLKNVTRYIFKPDDVSMVDDSIFWVQVTVNSGPAAGIQLSYPIISSVYRDRSTFIVSGSAPTGGMELMLPCMSDGIWIQNPALTPNLWVKYDPNGSEFVVPPLGANEPPNFPELHVSRLFMRGEGASASFIVKANLNISPSYQ